MPRWSTAGFLSLEWIPRHADIIHQCPPLAAFCSVYQPQHEVIWRLHSFYSESLIPSLHHEWNTVVQESTKYLVNCIWFVGLTLWVVGPLHNKVGQTPFKYYGIQAHFKKIFRLCATSLLIDMFHPSLEQIYMCTLQDVAHFVDWQTKGVDISLSSNSLNSTPNLPLFFSRGCCCCCMTFSLDSMTSFMIITPSLSSI